MTAEPRVAWAASSGATAHVFVERLDDEVEVTGAAARHLTRVRRLGAGEAVTATDGQGGWRPFRVARAGPDALLALEATGTPRSEPVPAAAVAVAPALTKAGLDDVVSMCTELGVVAIQPVVTERVVVRWDSARAERARLRWDRIAREAAARAFRCHLPRIDPPVSLAELSARPGLDLVLAEAGGGDAAALPEAASGTRTVLSGPEGGLAPAERARLVAVPRLGLGPFVLRAVLAPVAAAAVLGARAPDAPGVGGGAPERR